MNNDLRYRDGDHARQTWFTPDYVLNPVRADLYDWIDLDPCTTDDNPVGAHRFYTVGTRHLPPARGSDGGHRADRYRNGTGLPRDA